MVAVAPPTPTATPDVDATAGDDAGHPGRAPTASRRRPWLPLLLVLLAGVVVYLPSVRSEMLLDDYLHAAMIDGTYPAHRGPLELYDFVGDSERALLFERGMLPWWSSPQLRIRFLRPLPSLLRWSEQHAFGRSPLLPHLHSLLWWAAAVLAARRLFVRMLPERPALLATIVFALAPCHALPIGWLANREALISLTLGTLALTSFLTWREQGGGRHAAAACALFAASMAGGEYSLCLGGYVLALALLARGQSAGRRALGLALYGVPAGVYLAIRAVLGYGTVGSGFYNDPLHEPLAFLRVAPSRLAALLAQQWLALDGDTVHDTSSPWLLGAIVGVGLLVFALPLRRTFTALEPALRSRAVAMFAGAQLALVPVLAVDPSPRVLGVSMLGFAPAVALLLDGAWFPAAPLPRRGLAELTGLAALGLGFAQLIHGPATAWLAGTRYRQTSIEFVTSVNDLRERVPAPDRTELVILRCWNSSFFMPFALAPDGRPPARWRVLATTGHVLGLRKGPRTLELVVPRDQTMFSWDLFRDPNAHVTAGQVFDTPGLRATILEVGSEGPRRVRFDLDRDLDSDDTVWVTESSKGEFPSTSPPQAGFGKPYEP